MDDNDKDQDTGMADDGKNQVKFIIYGEEMIEKVVNSSGNSGRIYLPPEWIGTKVKVVKRD
jgi:putative transposon-encoded protein